MDKLIEESVKVDCILTDPPYLIDYKCNRRVVLDKFDKILNDKNSYDLIIESINKAYDILNDNSSIYMFCSWHNIDFFKSELPDVYRKLRREYKKVQSKDDTCDDGKEIKW